MVVVKKKSDIEARCSSIKQQIDETTSDYDGKKNFKKD